MDVKDIKFKAKCLGIVEWVKGDLVHSRVPEFYKNH